MDENLIKPISPSPTGVKYAPKKKHGSSKKGDTSKKSKKNKNDSPSDQGKVIDDYA